MFRGVKMSDFSIKFNEQFVRYKDKEIGAGNIMLMVSTYEYYMKKEIEKLEAENKKLREALEFYADTENKLDYFYMGNDESIRMWHREDDIEYIDGDVHTGKRAREVLKEKE
jgi:hypothetical protein